MFNRPRIVNVTSKQALDDALLTADQIVVQGDDALLSYAVARAAGAPGHEIAVKAGGHSIDFAAPALAAASPAAAYDAPPPSPAARAPAAAPAAAPAPALAPALAPMPVRRRFQRLWIIIAVILALLLALVAALLTTGQNVSGSFEQIAPSLAPATHFHHSKPPDLAPPATAPNIWASLAWPLVAIIGILALCGVTVLAIVSGRNVELSWKVTDKVSGKVVITKVRQRATRAA